MNRALHNVSVASWQFTAVILLQNTLNNVLSLYWSLEYTKINGYFHRGGYVITCICLYVCLSVNRITQELLIKSL